MTEQKTDGHPEGGAVLEVKRIANPNRQSFYANNTIVAVNQWDVQMYFSLVNETSPGQFGAVEQALIIMTPEHALAFSRALQKGLENYARNQGTIRDIKPVALASPTKEQKG